MKVLYAFILDKNDGGVIHANEFVKAFKINGNSIKTVKSDAFQFSASSEPWSIYKKIAAKLVWLLVNLIFFSKVVYAYLRYKPEVVIFRHTPNQTTFLAQWFIYFCGPILLEVNAINEIEAKGKGHKLRVALDRLLLSRASKIYVVSKPIKDFLVKANYCSPDKISVIENGVDEDRFDPNVKFQDLRSRFGISPETFVLGFIGSMKQWHGVGNIIRVAEFCKSKLANHLFVIVGDGGLKAEYEAQVKALGLNDTVKFIARISHDDVPSYLSFMDVVLSLHYKQRDNAIEFHGSPLKIFEYMAMEKPIIAAPLGQIKELIVSGDNGLLLDGENAEGICKALLQLEKDKSYRQKLGERARQNVIESHTWKINAKKVEELCQDILLKE